MAGVEQSVTSYCQYFLGDYDFFVRVGIRDDASSDEAEKVAKNVNFTFSKKLNKLFVKRRMKCPFGIGTTVSIPAGCRIKIHIFTTSSESNPVMRCMGHASTEHDNPDAPLHFFKSDNEDAVYRNCEKTGELSIHLPFRLYENNMDIETLQFLCCSSCVKGDTFIKFTLISAQEVVIGWHTFGLHVCSSPGRDRLLHENRSKRKIKKADTSKSKSQRTEGTQHTQSILETVASEEVHTLTTRSESVYEKLFKLNRGLELEEALTLEEQERILKRARSRQATHTVSSSNSMSSSTLTSRDNPSTSGEQRVTFRRILTERTVNNGKKIIGYVDRGKLLKDFFEAEI